MTDVGINVRAYDNASGVLNHVAGKMGIMNKQGLAMGIGFAGITMGIQAVMQAFQGLKQWVGESITKYREFETAIAEVSTMLDNQAMTHLPQLEKGIVELARTYGKSANDMARAMYQTLSASVDVADSLNFLEIATRAATAGLTTTEVAVDAITSVMNAYGMSVQQAEHISDVMFQTVKRGKLRFEDLANTISMVAPIAAKAGISFEEISAALATLTRQGINASKATMSLRQLISNIINPSTEAAEAASAYGITLDALHFRVVGINGILAEMSEAAKGNVAVMGQFIPNIRALQAALGLTGETADGFTKDINLMGDSLGATQIAMAKIVDTSGFMMDQIQAMSEEVDRATGESFQKFDMMMKTNEASMKGAIVEMMEFRDSLNDTESAIRTLFDVFMPWLNLLRFAASTEEQNKEITDQLTTSQEKLAKAMEEEWVAVNKSTDVFEEHGSQFVKYHGAMEQFDTDMRNIGHATMETKLAIAESQEGFNAIQGVLDTTTASLQDTQAIIVLLQSEIEKLNVSIPEMEKHIAGLEIINVIEDDLYRAGMAFKDFTFEGTYFSSSISGLVSNLKKYEYHLESLRSKQDAFNLASKKNSLEILQIQYAASGKRGRMSRSEKKQIEELERANMKNRIDQMKGDIEMTNFKESFYDTAKEQYNSFVLSQQHQMHILKSVRNEEMENAKSNLAIMLNDRDQYNDDLDVMFAEERILYRKHFQELAKISKEYADVGKPMPSGIAAGLLGAQAGAPGSIEMMLRNTDRDWLADMVFGNLQTGITTIPETGIYKLHQGETVTTKGATNAGGSGRVTVDLTGNLNVNITKTIGAGDDPEAWVAKKISNGVRRGLITTDIDTLYG